ncbi:MAG: Glutathione transport system permease protein GsiD [Syntrophomonadaceae bacterium]|nr:Glutathione transport system permease protein GsiD [Bacillota bacterium]
MKTAVSSGTDRYREMRRVFRQLRRNRLSMLGLLIISFFLLCAILAPLLAPYDPVIPNFAYALRQPSPQHLLGTDELGRDLLSRMLFGARTSLGIGFISVIIGAAAGVPLGALSGYYGGKLDLFLQRGIDVLIAFPGILLAIIVVSIMGVGLENAMIAIGVASIPVYTRLTRGSVLALKEMEYITAAKALGLSDARIIIRHILPNCLSPLIVQSTFQVATAILWAAGLGFLGLGAQPPSPEWGAMLSRGRVFMRTYPFLTTIPGLAIFLVVLGFNLFGDGLRDSLDPRARKY